MRTAKEFKFHAAHRDESAPVGDQCGRLHGHTYRLRIEVEGPLDERGMVLHGNVLKRIYAEVIEPKVEHQYLNETLDFNPTMESVCQWIADEVRMWLTGNMMVREDVVRVRLWETPTMYSETTA